jgi:hypothetical protein
MILMTFNVQGMSTRNKRVAVRTFLERFRPRIDAFFVQEHHLRAGEVKSIKQEVCRDAEVIVAPAFDGARALQNPSVTLGKGGIFLAISSRWSGYIIQQGVIPSELGVWCIMDHPHMGIFGILGVYAPTPRPECILLWNELFSLLDNSMPWLLLGDLNMTKLATDQWGGNPKNLAGRELRAFSHLKCQMKWEDSFQIVPGRIGYSWDNKQEFTHPWKLPVKETGY